MTFNELVRTVATSREMPLAQARRTIRATFNAISEEVVANGRIAKIPGFGNFVMVPMRSKGRRADGVEWTAPGRKRLSLRASKHAQHTKE